MGLCTVLVMFTASPLGAEPLAEIGKEGHSGRVYQNSQSACSLEQGVLSSQREPNLLSEHVLYLAIKVVELVALVVVWFAVVAKEVKVEVGELVVQVADLAEHVPGCTTSGHNVFPHTGIRGRVALHVVDANDTNNAHNASNVNNTNNANETYNAKSANDTNNTNNAVNANRLMTGQQLAAEHPASQDEGTPQFTKTTVRTLFLGGIPFNGFKTQGKMFAFATHVRSRGSNLSPPKLRRRANE
eukprot:5251185-Amphidinium_carterae.1